ncbi:MAG: hypothetical protein QOG15_2050 [Solirubrobacteraceae bacterium]|nr:hypothetical protein [Solirubrobacteraceae bacterium]
MAVTSLVMSILWLGWLGSILGLIFGLKAMDEIDSSNGLQTGKALAIAGTIISAISLIPPVIFIILLFN